MPHLRAQFHDALSGSYALKVLHERAVALDSTQAQTGRYIQHQLARIYILAGEQDQAVHRLEGLLRGPHYISPGWLRVDPTFDRVRNNPRLKRLVDIPVPAATH
jgi:hypothetical protein